MSSSKTIRLDFKKKKSKSGKKVESKTKSDNSTAFFGGGDNDQDDRPTDAATRLSVREFDGTVAVDKAEPLVIPVQTTGRTFGQLSKHKEAQHGQEDEPTKEQKPEACTTDETAEAIQVLQEEAAKSNGSSSNPSNKNNQQVIAGSKDTFQRKNKDKKDHDEQESELFQKDLDALPDAMDMEDYTKSRVSIADFGAAMLRGMGWKGSEDDNNNNNQTNKKKKSEVEPSLPRPHRLGLGATPKVMDDEDDGGRKRPRSMDQYERDKKRNKQAQDFARQRQKQVETDKQQTLQIGSLVLLLENNQRAKIEQLSGVPGLNQIKVLLEGQREPSLVKRGSVDRLLTRKELQEEPFRELKPNKSEKKRDKEEEDPGDRKRKRERTLISKDPVPDRPPSRDKNKERNRRDESTSNNSRKHEKRSSFKSTWLTAQIRVRIVTEKLGRRHFKEKGVVVDVTSKGSTVELPNRVVLDHIPERYLETALPKVGGRVIVLTSNKGREYFHCKGILLERGKGQGVVQLDSDKSILTLSLDDLAEWMGPVDDE